MVHIEVFDSNGKVLAEARLHEEHRHVLLPGTAGSVVQELMDKQLQYWSSILISVK